MSQLTEGKCLRCASFLSRPQNTCQEEEHAGQEAGRWEVSWPTNCLWRQRQVWPDGGRGLL